MSHIRNQAISEEKAVTYLLEIPEKILKLHIKSTDILSRSTIADGSCGFRALRRASKGAAIPVHRRDEDIYNKTERAAHIAWTETIIRTSAPNADISTLRMYVEWLTCQSRASRIGHGMRNSTAVMDRSWHINDFYSLAATLPHIGLFTIAGSAILHKATYIFHTNSKTYHHGPYPGSVLLDLVESSYYIEIHRFIFTYYQSDWQTKSGSGQQFEI